MCATNHFNANDIARLEYPTRLCLAHNSASAAYTMLTPNLDDNQFDSKVNLIDTASGTATPLDIDGQSDMPQYAWNDNTLAFLCDASGERQIWLRNPDGQIRQLTSLRNGVTAYEWSRDGRQIVFQAPLWPDDMAHPFLQRSAADKQAWLQRLANSPVAIEALSDHAYASGCTEHGSVACIGVVDVALGRASILTDGKAACINPAFSPDGRHLAFYSYPHDHHKAHCAELFILNLADSTVHRITEKGRCDTSSPPIFTPDGASVIFASRQHDESAEPWVKLCRVKIIGGEVEDLLPNSFCMGFSDYRNTNPAIQLSRCGEYIYYTSVLQGVHRLYCMALTHPPTVKHVPIGDGSVGAFSSAPDGTLLFSQSDIDKPAQLYISAHGETRQLGRLNPWAEGYIAAPWQSIQAQADSDAEALHGWVLLPPGLQAGEKCPALLSIGSPGYPARNFNLAVQAQAAAGVAVILCNTSGGSPATQDDLYALLDVAVSLGFIDETRIGIAGSGVGGTKALEIIGHTDRFAAAAIMGALCNLSTAYGCGDTGLLPSEERRPSIMSFLLNSAAASAIIGVDNIKTPLLILHGTADYRSPFEQAEQIFIAMKERNPKVPVRLVAFPGENHSVVNTGRPESQLIHIQELVNWFAQLGDGRNVSHDK